MAKKELNFSCFDSATPHLYAQCSEDKVYIDEISTLKKTTRSIGILNPKELIEYTFDIEKGLATEELDETVELKMYQEAALNHSIEYKIDYTHHNSIVDSKNITIHAVASPLHTLHELFDTAVSQSMYLDIILPYSALPKVLYSNNTLQTSEDIFIYFNRNEMTLSLYAEGEFIYSKTDDSGLQKLFESFIQISGEHIDYPEFTSLLTQKGLDESRYEHEEKSLYIDLKETIERFISELNNVIIYARRIGGLHQLSRIYLGTLEGTIPGIKTLLEEFTNIESHDYHFYTNYYLKGDPYIDQQKLLALMTAQAYQEDEFKPLFNFSIFPRPDIFYKRPSGIFVILSAIALAIILFMPLYYVISKSWLEYRTEQLLQTLNFSQSEFERFRLSEDESLKEHKTLELALENEKAKQFNQKKFLNSLTNHRKYTKKKLTFLFNILSKVNKNRAIIDTLSVNISDISLEVHSRKESALTALLKAFIKDRGIRVRMSSIHYESSKNHYTTSFKIKIKK
jgi:hypothetical protein